MGNSISPMIQLEEDTPSHHDDEKLPILNLSVWIERKEENGTSSEKIRYQFYRKPMANPLLIMARSVMPARVKRRALTQQALTIMKNTSQELPEDLKTQLLSEFSGRMQASGYGARYRLEIIKSAMTAFDKMQEEQKHKDRPINRPRSYQRETRKRRKCQQNHSGTKRAAIQQLCSSLLHHMENLQTCCVRAREKWHKNKAGVSRLWKEVARRSAQDL